MNILFVGNGSYQNRGCEAIVRGTMEILRKEFGADVNAKSGVFAPAEEVADQNINEVDPAIDSFPVTGVGRRFSKKWWLAQANKRTGLLTPSHLLDLEGRHHGIAAALELGGDNYSLDYGRPTSFMAVDSFLKSRGVPVILWGASVGPFDQDSDFAPRMFDHLRKLTAIFVRESESLGYLRANGVSENVHLVADPAFVMKPEEPAVANIGFPLPEGALGINLSPLMARFRGATAGSANLDVWLAFCVGLVRSAATLNRSILLIPHVESSSPENDDFCFLQSIYQATANTLPVPVQVLPRGLNAAELKWIIGRCSIFAGARTHSTIAALSSGVPTLSIGYSLKARGINQDIFGHLDYCLPVADLTTGNFTEQLNTLLTIERPIREQLKSVIPKFQANAFGAGPLMRALMK